MDNMPDFPFPSMEFHRLPKATDRNALRRLILGESAPTPGSNDYCSWLTSGIHDVKIIRLCDPIPEGWRVMTMDEGRCMKDDLQKMLTQWSIVAFDHGKLEGPGYGYALSETYGSECGERFVVKKTSGCGCGCS